MNTEFDYDLTLDQWEALKALRLPAAERRIRDRLVVSLTSLELASMTGDGPVITPKGRSVLLRGSPLALGRGSMIRRLNPVVGAARSHWRCQHPD